MKHLAMWSHTCVVRGETSSWHVRVRMVDIIYVTQCRLTANTTATTTTIGLVLCVVHLFLTICFLTAQDEFLSLPSDSQNNGASKMFAEVREFCRVVPERYRACVAISSLLNV